MSDPILSSPVSSLSVFSIAAAANPVKKVSETTAILARRCIFSLCRFAVVSQYCFLSAWYYFIVDISCGGDSPSHRFIFNAW